MMKRLLCAMLSFAVLLSISIPVFADEYDELRQLMLESFEEDSLLEIHEYALTMEQVQEVYDDLYHSGQLPWYADADCDYIFGQDEYIMRFRPKELNPRVYDRALYEQKMAELIKEVNLPGLEPWQLALNVYNYIAMHTIYDEQLMKNTGYDSLINGTTVCYGYSMLYMDVMNRLGIPCQIVVTYDTGEGAGHAWNAVQLDGQWYHVDTTWADPVPDVYGYACHEHFLKTDAEFKEGENPHNFDWEALVTIAEEPFTEDDFLDDVIGSVCFVDDHTVVFRREDGFYNEIISRNLETGEETVLYDYDRDELNLGYGWYVYSTLGLCFWNGRIYFNREERVLSMLPDGSDVQEVYTRSADDQYIVGCMVCDGTLHLTLTDHEMNIERVEVELEGVEYHTHSYHRYTVLASCKTDGYYEQVCDCGVTHNRVTIPQIGHVMQKEEVKRPTQQEAGQMRHYCILCDYEQLEEIPMLPAPEPVEETRQIPKWLQWLFR